MMKTKCTCKARLQLLHRVISEAGAKGRFDSGHFDGGMRRGLVGWRPCAAPAAARAVQRVARRHQPPGRARGASTQARGAMCSCGGLKVPPKRPMRMPGSAISKPRRARHLPCARAAGARLRTVERARNRAALAAGGFRFPFRRFRCRGCRQSQRGQVGASAARVQAAGGNADLAAEAEFAAVGELGRGVVQSTSLRKSPPLFDW